MANLLQCSLEIILPVHDFYHPPFYLDNIGAKDLFGALEIFGCGATQLLRSVVDEAAFIFKVVVFGSKDLVFGLEPLTPILQPVVSNLMLSGWRVSRQGKAVGD